MDAQLRIPQPVLELAGKSRLLSLADLCQALGYSEADCTTLMEHLVAAGLLQKVSPTQRGRGQVYYSIPLDSVPEIEVSPTGESQCAARQNDCLGGVNREDASEKRGKLVSEFAREILVATDVEAREMLINELSHELKAIDAEEATPKPPDSK